MGELIGYARVSTNEQTLDLQKDALIAAGCQRIFEDMISGSKAERPGLAAALAYMREGDTFVFWKLDRVSRSLHHLIELADEFERRGIAIRSLQCQRRHEIDPPVTIEIDPPPPTIGGSVFVGARIAPIWI